MVWRPGNEAIAVLMIVILCNVSSTQAQIKSYMMMLLKGVAYLHGNSIMHRVSILSWL